MTDGKADHPHPRDDEDEETRRRIRFPFGETRDGEDPLGLSDEDHSRNADSQSSDESSIVDALTWSGEESQEESAFPDSDSTHLFPLDRNESTQGSDELSQVDDESVVETLSGEETVDEPSDEDSLEGAATAHRMGAVDSAFALDAIDSLDSLDPVSDLGQGAVTRSFDVLETVGESSIEEANPHAWATETWERRLDDDLRRTLEEIDENDVDTAVVEKVYDEAKDFIPLDLESEIIDPSDRRGTDIIVESGSGSGQFIDLERPSTSFNDLHEDEHISEPIILVGDDDDEYTESMRFGASIIGGPSARLAGQRSARRPAQPDPDFHDDVSDSGSYVDASFDDGSFIAGTFVAASGESEESLDSISASDSGLASTGVDSNSQAVHAAALAGEIAALKAQVASFSKEAEAAQEDIEDEKKRRKRLLLLLLLFLLLLWPCSLGGVIYYFKASPQASSVSPEIQAYIDAKAKAEEEARLARAEAAKYKGERDEARAGRDEDGRAYDKERAELLAKAKSDLSKAVAAERKSLAAEVALASETKQKDLIAKLAKQDQAFDEERARLERETKAQREKDAARRRESSKQVQDYQRKVEDLQAALEKERARLEKIKEDREAKEVAKRKTAAEERKGDVVASLTKKSGDLSELRKSEGGGSDDGGDDEGWDDGEDEGWDDGEDSGGDDGWDDGEDGGWDDGEGSSDDDVWGDESDDDSWGDDGGSSSENETRKHPVVEIWDWAKEAIHGSIAYKNLTHFDDEDQIGRRFRRTRHEVRGEVEYKGPLVGPVSLYSEVFVQLDDDEYSDRVFQDHENRSKRRPKVSFDELYLLASAGSLDIRAGFQTIAWGTGDLQNPTDNFNPRDISDLFDNKKMGILAARLNYYFADFELEGIFVPFFTPTRIPPDGKRFSPAIPPITIPVGPATVTPNLFFDREFPEDDEAIQFGGRLSRSLGGWDFSVSYYDGFNKIPLTRVQAFQGAVGPNGLPELSLVTELFYEKIRVYGFDFATTLGWVEVDGFIGDVLKKTQIHGEGAYYDSREKTGDVYIQYVVGINYTFNNVIADHDIVLLLDYLDEVLLDEREILGVEGLLTNLSPQLQAIAQPFIPTINATIQERAELARGFRGSISSRLSYQFSDTFQFVFTSIFVLRGKENLFFQSKMVWDITDNLRFEAGHDYFSGPRETFFGQYRDNDRVFFVGKVSF